MSDRKTEIESRLAWWRRRMGHMVSVMTLALATTAGCGVDDPVDATPDTPTPTLDGALEESPRRPAGLRVVQGASPAPIDVDLDDGTWSTPRPLVPSALGSTVS